MSNIFIFHGVEGTPEENWFPWLKKELEKINQHVIVPQFPTPENQTLDNWLSVLDNYKDYLNDDAILVGHSVSVAFSLNIIEKHPVKAGFFVAGFTGKANNKFDEGMVTFAQREFDWSAIRNNCGKFFVFYSDNDPYVSSEKGLELANNLNVDPIFVKGAGHFNESSGYRSFDLLLEKIKEIL